MGRPLWVVDFLKKIYPKRFLVAKATKIPAIGRLLDHWLFNGDGLIFLPPDRRARMIPVNQSIDDPGEMVLPSRVVEHFVERASVHWVMNFCLCRAAEECEDYPIDLDRVSAICGRRHRPHRLIGRTRLTPFKALL